MKKVFAFALVLALAFALGAPAYADGAIKIGGTGPLTGGAAIYGNAAKNGAEIAVEEINAKGGIQFELRYEDDTHDAEKAVNAYNTLKDWGMQISLGSVTSKPCEATSAETYADRIFALTPSASSTTKATCYDFSGRPVADRALSAGMYIINDKKVVIR